MTGRPVVCSNCFKAYDKSESGKCPACYSTETQLADIGSGTEQAKSKAKPLPPHYIITGLTKKLSKIQLFAMRSSMRKRGATDQMIDEFIRDIENGFPRHEIFLPELGPFQTIAQVQKTLKFMEKGGLMGRTCHCSGQGIEVEWDKSKFAEADSQDPLNIAIANENGPIKMSLILVRENLLSEEECIWVGRASIKDMGIESQGCVVITNSKIWVGYFNAELTSAYANSVERNSQTVLQKLKGSGNAGMFRIDGIQVQSIILSASELVDLEKVLEESTSGLESPDAVNVIPPTGAAEALRELQGLFETGLITEFEFQSKRQKIIDRL